MSTGDGFNPIINAFAAIGFTSILAGGLVWINREALAAWCRGQVSRGEEVSRIVLAHDARAAWLESLPELQTAFKHEGELTEFVMRAAAAGHQLVAEGTDIVAQLAIAGRA